MYGVAIVQDELSFRLATDVLLINREFIFLIGDYDAISSHGHVVDLTPAAEVFR